MADNSVTVCGNVVAPPELRFVGDAGAATCEFRVAVNRRLLKDGEWTDGEAQFFSVTAWRHLAEHCAESLDKGQRVVVTGMLRQRTWETDDGSKRSVVEIEASDVGVSLMFGTATYEKAERRT